MRREDSESVTATSVTSSPAAHDRLVFPQIQGEVARWSGKKALCSGLHSQNIVWAAAQKKLQWGKDHCEKNGVDGVEVSERLEMRFDFDGTVIIAV